MSVPSRRKVRLAAESLEDRLTPSTLFVDAAGVLTYTAGAGVANHLAVNLDPATDTYRFSDAEVINAPGFLGNGTTTVFVPNARVTSMKVLLGDAADALTVESAQDSIQVQAGAGDDTVTLVSAGGTLDGIQGRISVAGEDGSDTLTVNDQGAAAGKGYVLTASTLTRAGVVLVSSYGTLEQVNLNTTGLADSVAVRGTAPGTAVQVNAGFGDDTLTVGGAGGGLDGVQGPLGFNGQDGTGDRLIVDDTGSSAGRFFDVSTTSVARSGSAQIDYFLAESVVVKGGAFDDTFNVRATLSSTPVTVNTGDGNDTVTVGTAFLESIQGPLTVNGQAGGGDVLDISDAGTVGRTYTVTSTTVSRPGAALIKYGTVENVAVNGTIADDRFNVLSTAAGTAVTLRAGGGNDVFVVGSNADSPGSSTLNLIQGALTLDAGVGIDHITLNDPANGSGQTFTVTSAGVSRSGMAPINYSFQDGQSINQDSLMVNAGGAGDVVNVRTTAANTSYFLDLGKGDDTVNVGNYTVASGSTLGGIQGTLTINGGDGTDVVNLNDQQLGTFNPINPTGQSYTLYAYGVSRSGAADVVFDDAPEGVVLNAGPYDDTVIVSLGYSTVPVTVNAGGGADTIRQVESTLEPGVFLGRPITVNGQGGSDTLDYSSLGIDVRVNLTLGTATGLVGLSGVENVAGGGGDDTLVGDAGDNALTGGGGRDLLIGREGADQLFGGAGEDILIGNATALDADPAALEAVMAEWGRGDLGYGQRIQHLKLGGGNNGAVKLDLTKSVEDGARDTLTGGDAPDWFFLTGADFAPDLNQPAVEQVN